MPLGIVASNVSPQAYLKLRRENIVFPLASDNDFFVASTSIAAATAGTVLTRTTDGAKPLAYARLPQITATDASGSTLAVTVQLIGKRHGRRVVQSISTSGGTATVAGTSVIDELDSATITAISGNASSDTLIVGFNNARVGLLCPIKSIKSVKMVTKIANGTPSAPNSGATVQTSSIVKVSDASIDVFALYSSTAIAVTDQYIVEYLADGVDEFGVSGKFA